MKAPVGLLSDRTVLRSKMEGLCPAKDCKGRIFSALVTYAATGILAFSLMEG